MIIYYFISIRVFSVDEHNLCAVFRRETHFAIPTARKSQRVASGTNRKSKQNPGISNDVKTCDDMPRVSIVVDDFIAPGQDSVAWSSSSAGSSTASTTSTPRNFGKGGKGGNTNMKVEGSPEVVSVSTKWIGTRREFAKKGTGTSRGHSESVKQESDTTDSEQVGYDVPKLYVCGYCPFECLASDLYKLHLAAHQNCYEHACTYCSFSCATEPELHVHLAAHMTPRNTFVAPVAQSDQFPSVVLLEPKVTVPGGCLCPYCGYRPPGVDALKNHLGSHILANLPGLLKRQWQASGEPTKPIKSDRFTQASTIFRSVSSQTAYRSGSDDFEETPNLVIEDPAPSAQSVPQRAKNGSLCFGCTPVVANVTMSDVPRPNGQASDAFAVTVKVRISASFVHLFFCFLIATVFHATCGY